MTETASFYIETTLLKRCFFVERIVTFFTDIKQKERKTLEKSEMKKINGFSDGSVTPVAIGFDQFIQFSQNFRNILSHFIQ